MGVFTRLTDIIQSNVVLALDKAEDPEKLVRLMIQEMEQTLVEVRSTQASLLAEKKELQKQQVKYRESQVFWQEKAQLAVDKNRDDLAKSALIEKNKVNKDLDSLDSELTKLDDALNKITADSQSLQSKLAQAKAKQAGFEQRVQTANSRLKIKTQLHSEQINNALARFESIERKVDEIEAEVESYELGEAACLKQEFAKLEGQEEIDKQLAELKKKVVNA